MDYRQTLDYLYSHLPMFTRVGPAAFKKDLTNTIAFCARLGNPHHKFRSVHIGGTNGKGSTSHMLAAILQEAGYKTGLYTSPHLKDFRERIRINGEMIPEEDVTLFVEKNDKFIEDLKPSFFETTVAMAFDHFARNDVDIAVIEVGLGGRLDSTNVITPLLSVITNISFDHMNMLGNTLREIAAEKAGIIKQGVPVIIGEKQAETAEIFLTKAATAHAPITFADEEWILSIIEPVVNDPFFRLTATTTRADTVYRLALDLTGSYQAKNLKTVLAAVSLLNQRQDFFIPESAIISALKKVRTMTGLSGRWQLLAVDPLVICDTGHNEDGIKEVINSIGNLKYKRLHLVFGMVKDKAIAKILILLPENAIYYFCSPGIERALPATDLKEMAASFGLQGKSFSSVSEALTAAKANAGKDDLIFIGGSTFVVAEIELDQGYDRT